MHNTDITPKEHFHGSDLEKIEKLYNIKKEEIVSFSANVNPLGLSPLMKAGLQNNIDCLCAYPDREYLALRKAIAEYVSSCEEYVLVGNGSTELISLFSTVTHPQKALIVGPTYSEYEHEIGLNNGVFTYYELKEADNFRLNVNDLNRNIDENTDLCVICNPNNPTSQLITLDDMEAVVKHCKKNNTFVVVDETYMEFVYNYRKHSAINLADRYDNLVILRGVSKFFACPGLRLGYAVCSNRSVLEEIKKIQLPWSVNSLAEEAGKIMFRDTEYIINTAKYINSEREYIYKKLSETDALKVYKPEANFVLCRILVNNHDACELFETAIKQKLMIRDCANFTFLDESYFRFCFMKKEDNEKLLGIISDVFSK